MKGVVPDADPEDPAGHESWFHKGTIKSWFHNGTIKNWFHNGTIS